MDNALYLMPIRKSTIKKSYAVKPDLYLCSAQIFRYFHLWFSLFSYSIPEYQFNFPFSKNNKTHIDKIPKILYINYREIIIIFVTKF